MTRSRWTHIRRLAAREAVRRAWGVYWRDNARTAEGCGRTELAEDCRARARREFERARKLRARVLETA